MDKLVHAFVTDADALCAEVGVARKPHAVGKSATAVPSDTEEEELTCDVCVMDYDRSKFFALDCGHLFCLECWAEYLSVAVGVGALCLCWPGLKLGLPLSLTPSARYRRFCSSRSAMRVEHDVHAGRVLVQSG